MIELFLNLFVLVAVGALSYVWGAHIQMLRDIRALHRAREQGYLDEDSVSAAVDWIESQQ